MKFETFKNKSENSLKMTHREKLKSDGNHNYIITWSSYLAKMKLQYAKIIFNRVEFYIMMVYIIVNISKQAHVINKLGRLGTGVPLAPVLEAGGKPST